MSIKDLLPQDVFEDLLKQAHLDEETLSQVTRTDPNTVICPQCGSKTNCDKTNPYRPFCSNRCRLLDLGAWAGGERFIRDSKDKDDMFSESSEN